MDTSKPSTEKENTNLIQAIYVDLNSDLKIEDLFFNPEEELIIVSKDRISKLEFEYASSDFLEEYEMTLTVLFNNKRDADTENLIKDVKFSKENKMFYLMLENEGESRMFVRFLYDPSSATNSEKKKLHIGIFPKLISEFELHRSNPDILYLIIKNEVFEFNITSKEGKVNGKIQEQEPAKLQVQKSGIRVPGTQGRAQGNNKNQNKKKGGRGKKKGKKKNTFKRVFSNPKNAVLFYRFNLDMKFFYSSDGSLIKKYLTETKSLINTYEGHENDLKNITFSEDFKYMFRCDLF